MVKAKERVLVKVKNKTKKEPWDRGECERRICDFVRRAPGSCLPLSQNIIQKVIYMYTFGCKCALKIPETLDVMIIMESQPGWALACQSPGRAPFL